MTCCQPVSPPTLLHPCPWLHLPVPGSPAVLGLRGGLQESRVAELGHEARADPAEPPGLAAAPRSSLPRPDEL